MFKKIIFCTAVAIVPLALMAGSAFADSTSDSAEAYIISPADGARVSSPVTVQFGLRNMGVAPAGTIREGTGHHHLLIDVDELPAMDQPIPSDAQHRHFGGGQTEVLLDLPPGKHRLQLLLGDAGHVPHNPPVLSAPVTILVE